MHAASICLHLNHVNDDRNLYVSKNATYEVKAEREDNMTGIANNKRETRVGRLTETLSKDGRVATALSLCCHGVTVELNSSQTRVNGARTPKTSCTAHYGLQINDQETRFSCLAIVSRLEIASLLSHLEVFPAPVTLLSSTSRGCVSISLSH